MSGETPSKSSGDASHGLMKKLKSVDRPSIVEAGDSGAKPRVLERYVKLKHFPSVKLIILLLHCGWD